MFGGKAIQRCQPASSPSTVHLPWHMSPASGTGCEANICCWTFHCPPDVRQNQGPELQPTSGISACFRSPPGTGQGARANQWAQLKLPTPGRTLSYPGRDPGPSLCMAVWAEHWAHHARQRAPSAHFFLSLRHIWSLLLGFFCPSSQAAVKGAISLAGHIIFFFPFSLPDLYLLGCPSSPTLIWPGWRYSHCKRREEHPSATCRNHRAPTALNPSSSSSKLPRLPRPPSRSLRNAASEPPR